MLLIAAVITGKGAAPVAASLAALSLLAVSHRVLLRWEALVGFVVIVVLAIPIKRYGFAVSLPFDLEPYRIAIAIVIGFWILALLVDPAIRLRGSAIDAPLALLGLTIVASVASNPGAITQFSTVTSFVGEDFGGFLFDATQIPYVDVSSNVAKELLIFASLLLVFYFVVSVIRTPAAIHSVLKTIVIGAAFVAALAIVERRTRYNVFNHLEGWIPLISFEGVTEDLARGGRLRVYASAQHPIALAALLCIVTPISVYLSYVTRRWLWYAATAALVLGALATVSRTSVTMLAAIALVFLVLRPQVLKPLLVAILPVLIVVHLVLPGAIGSLRAAFFPQEGLLADQTVYGGRISAKRLGPQFDIVKAQPLFGQGYGTRVTAGPDANARILDNQWLATAVETGLAGVVAWVWIFLRFLRRAGGAAKGDTSARGWLLTALSGSAAAFSVGMLTFDAFSFIQVTFIMFVLLALGASTLACREGWPEVVAEGVTSADQPASVHPSASRARR